MYAYPGAYYDAFGADLDESTIDPNDGTTWYYDINSWLPGTVGYTRDGRQSNTRGGHFYMNQLMGSNKGNEKSGAWTTDTGMFGGDVSQSIKNNSNILNVKRPELEIITTPSALCGGAPYIDTMTPDEYGQMLLLSNAAATMANGTATYEAILYYKPGDLVPTPTWQYMTYTDHAPKFWADSTGNKWTGSKAQQLGVNVTVTNTDLGDALYQGQPGYKAIKSVMTISNVPASMYNPETLTKYYFRCIGVTTYTTVKDTYSMARVDKWGGLVIDYAIDLHHNGVVNYGNTNIINGATVTDAAGIVQATTGRQSSVWTYPKLSIHVPAGHHINTAIVYFDSKVAHNSNDYISYNTSALTSLGITVQEADANKLVLISTTKNTVELDTWQTALRNYVSFTTYDNADFTASKVAAGTTGGAKIRWVVDELRLAGVQVDPNTGKAFKVVNAGKIISWDDAFSLARAYDPDIGTNGRLAEITNASENSLIYNLKGGDNGVRVWLGANSTGGWWQWKTSGNGLAYTPGGISGDGPYLVQNSNGSWSGLKASSNTSREVTMYNLGKGWSLVFSGTLSHNVWMENGHKYYVLAKFGDYFDANGYGPISCSALGIYARNNWCSDYNAWMSGVDDVYTYHNNRVYDQTSAGVIRNIQPEARSGDSGIIPGDTVRFNTTTVFGSYVDKNGKAAVHNSNTNNGGSEYTMYRSATLSDLYVLHTGGSDPHHNYTLGTETYTGAINKRPVVVHSLYLDDPENPRNVKTYDSTNQATITDILIDNVLPGDEIGLKQQTMTGTYATAQAGETLTADGKTQKDRLKKLNYSNGAIRVTDINVDPTGGFLITDKAPLDLLRGEMSMNMFGTQLVPGANTPANPERWIAAADESEGVDGVFLHLPLECYIAGGNVNDETVCTPVTKVQYTIAEYGKTVPEVDDAELPEYIHGEPVTPSTTG